ncbi:MAG: hypothetical protein ACREFP_16105 [Acetobacteraceae bacterium]
MGKRWFFISGAAAVVVAAALYGGLVAYPQARFRAALSAARQFLPAGVSLDYKSADYSLFSDRGTLTGVALHSSGPLPLDVAIARVELLRPSLALGKNWQRAEHNPAALRPETAIPVAAALKFSDVSIHTPSLSEKITAARINGLRLYPWALLHPGIPTLADVMTALARRRQPRSLAAIVPILRFEAAMVLGVGNTGVDLNGITATLRLAAIPGLPARKVTYRIASTTGPANERGIFGAGTAAHVAIALGAPAGTVTIEKIAIGGWNLRNPAKRLLAASTLSPSLLSGLAIGRLQAAAVALQRPSGPPITLGTLTLSRIAVSDGLPVSAAFSWHGLLLTRAEMPTEEARLAFARLGLDTLTVNLDAAYNWELDANRIALQNARLDVAQLGSLALSASLVEVTPHPGVLDRARLAHAVLRYKDASLVARASGAAASLTDTSPQSFRQRMITLIRNRADEFASSPAITEAAKAITTFLRAPHSLTITFSPADPVPLAALRNAATMTPPALASLVGLSVTANQ